MRNTSQKRYDKKSKMCRVYLADYLAIKGLSQQLGVTMAEAFRKLITGQPKPEPKPEPAALFKPRSIEHNGAAAFKPKSVSGNGITRLKVKSIK
ncbi:hypothetical protein ES705_38997 [subsurface metagenome]